jgi:hypothetical protein
MVLIGGQEGLQGPSVRIVQILVRYRVSSSKAVVPQLQFWHLYKLVFAQSMGGLCVLIPCVFHFVSHRDVDLIVETQQRPGEFDLDNIVQIAAQQYQLQYCKPHAAVFFV